MNQRKVREKTRTFDWKALPPCKHQKAVKTRSGMVIYVCLARKGSGRYKQICTNAGIEAKCQFYSSKQKWGRSLFEMAGDLI
jgi:hypothetical protein